MTAFLFFIASIFCYYSQNIIHLILSRTLIGVAVGIVSFCGPLYLSEISPKEKRGQIVSLHQLAITFGILFSYLSNYFCSSLSSTWRMMFLVGIVPAIVLFIGLFFQKDTPRWYVIHNRIEDAKKILKLIDNSTNVDLEIENIKKTLKEDEKIQFSKKLIMPFVIGIGIMVIQIATGINAIIYYAPIIFKMIGFSSNQNALLITIIIGLINFLMTFVASGYEHSIANMFFIPSGILMKSVPEVVMASGFTSEQLMTLSWKSFFVHNLIPVTLGNVVGALVFVVLLFWMAYLKDDHKTEISTYRK